MLLASCSASSWFSASCCFAFSIICCCRPMLTSVISLLLASSCTLRALSLLVDIFSISASRMRSIASVFSFSFNSCSLKNVTYSLAMFFPFSFSARSFAISRSSLPIAYWSISLSCSLFIAISCSLCLCRQIFVFRISSPLACDSLNAFISFSLSRSSSDLQNSICSFSSLSFCLFKISLFSLRDFTCSSRTSFISIFFRCRFSCSRNSLSSRSLSLFFHSAVSVLSI
mmetsp:Transcript_15781/g.23441  ORF Transcript_15781/g.23441 Transcript_15781/m.23441 type:complete len:228 (-) Transcript_15781:775-1458(-)